jgi:hypothetical protein
MRVYSPIAGLLWNRGAAAFALGACGAGAASIRSAGYGRMKLRARSGSRQASQSSHSARGTMTAMRFSLLGAWKRFISGCLSDLIVSVAKLNSTAPASPGQARHSPAIANSGSCFSQIRQRTDVLCPVS